MPFSFYKLVPEHIIPTISVFDDQNAHNVVLRLENNDQEFNTDLGERWLEYVDQYNQIARDYKLSSLQKLKHLQNILCKDTQ